MTTMTDYSYYSDDFSDDGMDDGTGHGPNKGQVTEVGLSIEYKLPTV